MDYSIHDDCFAALVDRGLLQDLATLVDSMKYHLQVEATADGWVMKVTNPSRVLGLSKSHDSLTLFIEGTDRKKQYPCDAENAVGAAIDLMKMAVRR